MVSVYLYGLTEQVTGWRSLPLSCLVFLKNPQPSFLGVLLLFSQARSLWEGTLLNGGLQESTKDQPMASNSEPSDVNDSEGCFSSLPVLLWLLGRMVPTTAEKSLVTTKLCQRIRLVWALEGGRPSFQRRQWHPTPVLFLENPMDGGAWWAAVHGVTRSRTRLSDFPFTFHFHALEKEMATHSSVLAWRIPGAGEPGGLPSMGSHRVGHDWSDLAAAAAADLVLNPAQPFGLWIIDLP